MEVHLIGGGWDDALAPTIYGQFVSAAARRAAAGVPRILLVVMGTDADSLAYHEKYVHTLGLVGGHELVVERVAEGAPFDPGALEGVDALFVGGGPTPEYHASLAAAYPRILSLVTAGMPYAGFSAGAAIAASHAIIGGWRLGGRAVCPEESNEDLDAVTVVPGIGLVDGAVDVHAAQWGNLSRLVAVVEAGLAPLGVAIDEDTLLGPDGAVVGAGRVWHVRPPRETNTDGPRDAPATPGALVRAVSAGQ
ncbi:MAG: peptidase S51 [Humibacillus sp.]